MPTDFLEQLAEIDVPPPPPEFDRNLHQRLNHSLVVQQILDLGLHILPGAAMEFSRAVMGMLTLTVAGKFPSIPNDRKNSDS